MFKRLSVLTAATLAISVSVASAAEIRLGGGGASITTVFIPIKPSFEKATGNNLITLQSTPQRWPQTALER